MEGVKGEDKMGKEKEELDWSERKAGKRWEREI